MRHSLTLSDDAIRFADRYTPINNILAIVLRSKFPSSQAFRYYSIINGNHYTHSGDVVAMLRNWDHGKLIVTCTVEICEDTRTISLNTDKRNG